MKPIKKVLKVSKGEYIKKHLEVINIFLPIKMTDREMDILSSFMVIDGVDKFSISNKKLVCSNLGISASNMNMYIGKLVDKGFIVDIDGILEILPILYPSKGYQDYIFRITEI